MLVIGLHRARIGDDPVRHRSTQPFGDLIVRASHDPPFSPLPLKPIDVQDHGCSTQQFGKSRRTRVGGVEIQEDVEVLPDRIERGREGVGQRAKRLPIDVSRVAKGDRTVGRRVPGHRSGDGSRR